MARKHPRHGPYEYSETEEEAPVEITVCWLCGRPAGKTIIWHHRVPKSRGGRDTVPMHSICQQTLTVNFSNCVLATRSPRARHIGPVRTWITNAHTDDP